jgi:hypothetical protein
VRRLNYSKAVSVKEFDRIVSQTYCFRNKKNRSGYRRCGKGRQSCKVLEQAGRAVSLRTPDTSFVQPLSSLPPAEWRFFDLHQENARIFILLNLFNKLSTGVLRPMKG